MPIFGYSERDLDGSYKQGVREGRAACTYELFNALNEVFPDSVHITNRNPHSGIPGIIRGLGHIREQERSRCSRQQSEIEFLKYVCSKLEDELDTLESGNLHARFERLTAERDQLRQKAAATQNELDQLRETYRAERQKLLDEIEQMDGLVVEYESKTQNAR